MSDSSPTAAVVRAARALADDIAWSQALSGRPITAAAYERVLAECLAKEPAYLAGEPCGFPCFRRGQIDCLCYCQRRIEADL